MEDEGAEEGGEDEGGRAHALAHGEDGDGQGVREAEGGEAAWAGVG